MRAGRQPRAAVDTAPSRLPDATGPCLVVGALSALVIAHTIAHRLGATWGSTREERRRALPGDDIVADPFGVTNHAVTIDAPPGPIWSWIVQMGYHRAGWYTPDWIDHVLFGMDNPNADHIVEEYQSIGVGSVIPDGPPDTAWFEVAVCEPHQTLVLHSTTHIPPPLRDRATIDWTWTFQLEPAKTPGMTRVLLRVRVRGSTLMRLLWHSTIQPADFVMSRAMLRGIRARAESVPWQVTTGEPAVVPTTAAAQTTSGGAP